MLTDDSSPGGTDAGAMGAWRVALNQTSDYWPNFSGLLDYDLMSMLFPLRCCQLLTISSA